jgi:HAD superfamily hydrolase (TIGR01457 family)
MLAAGYDVLLFDLDGVLFRGDEAIDGADATLAALREARVRMVFVTNNSSRTPEQIARKLRDHGIEADPTEVVTSALATADLLAARGGGTAFVIGEDGIRDALSGAGVELADGEPEAVEWVVVGLDRHVSYAQLRTAGILVQRGARLVATNPDRSLPMPDGVWPGAGALLAVVTETTGAPAEVVGKPFAPLFEAALRRAGGGRPLVIGDRLDTDIAGAAGLGWDSLLVLTGVSSEDEVTSSPTRPTFLADDVSALLRDADQYASGRGG